MIETISQLTLDEWGKIVLILSSTFIAFFSVFLYGRGDDKKAIYAILLAIYFQIILNT